MQKIVYTKCRKLVLSILIAAFAVLGIFVFAACSDDVTEADFKAKGYTVAVTYDFQGGSANSKPTARILIRPNSKLPAPSASNNGGIAVPTMSGYSFKGFYLPETDADGNVVKDADGKVVVSDTAWDFANDRVESKDVTLYAKWWDNYKVVLHYGSDYSKTKEISLQREQDGSPTKLAATPLNVDNYTFLSYNFVKDSENASTALAEFPYAWGADAFVGSDSVDVWGKSLDGIYTLVRTKDDLRLSAVGETTNYYLLADIDMGGAKYDNDLDRDKRKLPKSYAGKFVGNGHTISNFGVTMHAADRSYDSFGLFRTLTDGAEITDVTFKDISLSYNLSDANIRNYYLGMLAGQSTGNVKVSNVNFTSSNTFEYLLGVGVKNDNLTIADDMLIAQKSDSVVMQNCSVASVKHIYSSAVITADKEFALYVKYTEENGVITLGEDAIYKLGVKNDEGGYDEKQIKKCVYVDVNKYQLTRIIYVYDIEFTIENGNISVTMVEVKGN
ncbi:MAG: hypothetical protein K2F90_05165 [Clostridiales bacterium]|nr:hypothetical protein [Clostridiales bacterium]